MLLAMLMLSAHPVIAVAGISHESESFSPAVTTLEDFQWPPSNDRAAWLRDHAAENTTLAGYIDGAKQFGLDLYPTVVVGATPKGPVAGSAFETMMAEMIRRLKALARVDGVLLALHGAMVVETYPHGDTELVRRVREAVGPKTPVVVTHDFHANITPEIVELSTALVTFKENPHVDTRECGLRAARILALAVSGKAQPVQAVVKPPMIFNIVYQHTRRAPLLPIVEESRAVERKPGVLACSVSGGYQYADVPWLGPSVVVVTDNDRELAAREAKRLSGMLWAARDQLKLDLPESARAVTMAMSNDRFPVALIDMGDNIGGGSAGNTTFVLEELLKQKASGWVVTLADPRAVREAMRLGVGAAFDFAVGDKPVQVRGVVKSLHLGKYVETEIRHGGGRYWDNGLSAVIAEEGSTRDLENLLLLTSLRSSPNSIHQLVSCGIYPERQKILVVKGAIAPRAAYEPVVARIIEVDSPGLTAVNPKRFTYRLARRPLFGLE